MKAGLLKEAKINNLPLKDTQERVQAFFMQFNQLRGTARPVVQCVMKSIVTTSIISGPLPCPKLSMWSSRGVKTEHGWPVSPGHELGTPWRQFGNSREELDGFWSCLQMRRRLGSLVVNSHMGHGAGLESLRWGAQRA